MNHRKMFGGLCALTLVVGVANAAPTRPIERVMDPGPPVAPHQLATVSNYRLSTGFEAVDGWDLGFQICGATFANCFGLASGPVPNVCAPKNHPASMNCCFDDPNEDTGVFLSGSSQHCREPHIDSVNPFNAGGQHMRFVHDPLFGNPPGCTGQGAAACRQSAFFTAGVAFSSGPISRVQTSQEINMAGLLGSSMGQGWGNYIPPAVAFDDYIYWYYLGAVYNYSLYYGGFVFAGYWPDGQWINHSVDFDPCRNTVTYSLGGSVYFIEPYGFTHPNGAPGDRATSAPSNPGHVTNAAIFIFGQFPGTTFDVDDTSAIATECPDACCNRETSLCIEGLDAAECAALGALTSWYENVPCDMLGAPPFGGEGFPQACVRCMGPADCPDDGIFCNGPESCDVTSGLCIGGNPCLPNQVCDELTDQCVNFGACCLGLGTVCVETVEPDCVDLPPDGAGGVFLGAGSTCPQQNAAVIPEGNGTVFVHVVGPPVECPFPRGPARTTAACPPSGPYTDPWVSEESGGMCHDFGSPDTDPIPAGFFDPGSDPFTSTVCLRGVPLGVPGYGDADTLISRSADPFDRCDLPSGTPAMVNIEIVALSLESINPITVTSNGGSTSETWNVTVDLSPGGLPPSTPPRTLTATKSHCNGGTYTSLLYVQPRFTFTKVSNPSEVRVLDTGMTGTPPVELVQSDPHPWVSDIDPFLGVLVDFCSDFHANISERNPLLVCDCNANSRRDLCDIEDGVSFDCNANGVPDSCDISNATSQDVNGNGVPDECERGACCDFHVKSCIDDVFEADCPGPGREWELNERCADDPCGPFHCGPGDHWIDSCPGGTDFLDGTVVYVSVDLDLDPLCLAEVAVALTGDAEISRGAGIPHSMPTEMVSMTATGGGLILTVGVPLTPSLGTIVEKGDPSKGHSTFNVFFKLDLGGGVFVYNQDPCVMEGQLTKVPPKVAVYTRLPGCLPLYTSPTPGTGIHVANLAAAWHCVGKDCTAGACCDGMDGSCINGAELGNCLGEQQRWAPNTLCADLDPPCVELTGACCDRLEGTCTDGLIEAECGGAQRIWSSGVTCAVLEAAGDCEAVLGACCDGDAFGSCTQKTQSACNCQQCTWYKLTLCDEIDCPHEAIPTVSVWGLVILTLLLLIGAKVYFARRQTAMAF